MFRRFLANDRLAVLVLVGIAALLRLPFLDARGSWDSDQGHDLLVLRALVRDGEIPLLGPPTSIGDFHHGALYYFLLAPAAFFSGAQPFAVVLELALLGIAAVPVVWWFARSIGGPIVGPVAGFVAGFLIAVSPSAIETSTFIWNPNPIPLFAALAYACAWRGRQTGRASWWAVAVVCAGVVMQLHVLGSIFLVAIVVAALVMPGRDEPGSRATARRAVVGGLAIVALTYLPLLAYELSHGWAETRNVAAFFTAGGAGGAPLDPLSRLVFTALRAIGWPLVGLVTDVALPAVVAVAVAIALAAWRARAGIGEERFAARWLGATVLWGIVGLTIMAPSLATVVEGLPNDHYHAFLDPAVFVLVGLGIGALVAERPAAVPSTAGSGPDTAVTSAARAAPPIVDRSARGLALLGLIGLLVVDVGQWPPRVAIDGGYPAAERAAEQILEQVGDRRITLAGLPAFKTTEGVDFPLRVLGAKLVSTGEAEALVVVCDRLFEPVMDAECGGSAEEAIVGTSERFVKLLDRFPLSARTEISIYLPGG